MQDENLNLQLFLEMTSIIERIKSKILNGEIKSNLIEKSVFESHLVTTERNKISTLLSQTNQNKQKRNKNCPCKCILL